MCRGKKFSPIRDTIHKVSEFTVSPIDVWEALLDGSWLDGVLVFNKKANN